MVDITVTSVANPSIQTTVTITSNGPTEFCQGNFLNLDGSLDGGNYSYTWMLDGQELGTEGSINVTATGIYTLFVTDTNSGCEATADIQITVTQPLIPTISSSGNLLISTEATYYQWFKDGVVIANSNNQQLNITEPGEYYVGTVDTNGCFGNSNIINIETVSTKELADVHEFSIFPNPVNELLFAKIELEKTMNFQVEIIAADGQILKEKNNTFGKSDFIEINISDFPSGVYFLKLKNENGSIIRRFVKM